MKDDTIETQADIAHQETHHAPRYWDSWQIGHTFRIWEVWPSDHSIHVTVLGPNCVWGVK